MSYGVAKTQNSQRPKVMPCPDAQHCVHNANHQQYMNRLVQMQCSLGYDISQTAAAKLNVHNLFLNEEHTS